MNDIVSYAILGYGGRGREFAALLRSPELFGTVAAVAEPDPDKRAAAAQDCGLTDDRLFKSAADLLAQPRLADAVINTTQDQLHIETAIPALQKGYHLLLEKPMAVTLEDCMAIEEAQRKSGLVVGICHSLRYHKVYATIKNMIDEGAIGEVISIDQLEGVGDVHYSHSYVRGNWANEGRSTFMLMSKSCHDIDLFSYLVGRKCERVSSFGSLTYFTPANKPAGAPPRCLDGCPAENTCPYHSGKIYLTDNKWRYVFARKDDDSVLEYLRTGPYGRCVFDTDNDVVDHQVVSLEYAGGVTATFTMTAFHPGDRLIRVHGTTGYVEGSLVARQLTHVDFVTRNKNLITLPPAGGGHGGGDYLVLKSISDAIRSKDPSAVLTTAQESLESHAVVFAAEEARRTGSVVKPVRRVR